MVNPIIQSASGQLSNHYHATFLYTLSYPWGVANVFLNKTWRIQTVSDYLSGKYGEVIQKIKKVDAKPHILIREKHTSICCAFGGTIT